MKSFAIYCTDKPGKQQKRLDLLQEHLTHVENVMDRILVAGPLKDDDGTIIGSMLIVKADDSAGAQEFLKSDPYYHTDIWAKVEITEFLGAAGEWVGGKTW